MEFDSNDIMDNSLNHDPYARPANEQEFGTKHPRRFEPSIKTIEATQPQQRMRARVHHSTATQSIPDGAGAGTDVIFDVVDFDTSGILVVNQFKIPLTGKVTGTWLFHVHATWAAGTAGLRELDVLADGVIIASGRDTGSATNEQSMDVMILVNDPIAGTLYKVQARQTSGGGALNLNTDATKTYFETIHLW